MYYYIFFDKEKEQQHSNHAAERVKSQPEASVQHSLVKNIDQKKKSNTFDFFKISLIRAITLKSFFYISCRSKKKDTHKHILNNSSNEEINFKKSS